MKFLFICFLFLAPPFSAFAYSTTGIPTVGTVNPRTAIKDATVYYSTLVSDNDLLKKCELFLDEKSVTSMIIKKDVVYTTHKITTNGTKKMYTKCTDTDNNVVSGKEVSVVVSSGSLSVKPGDLIKMGCVGNVMVNDPCTSVYYYGVDGKRHSFPNEKVFKSWFDNFDDLVIVSANVLSDIPLGKNVTFRPDKRLIKFSTNTVYAISYVGLLRPIANAAIAESIFGKDWVSLIETVDDVFYGNYRIGATVESSTAFSWKDANTATKVIDATF
ncbi:hypothetical protein HY771_03725 [Candidatus Uhrbacteria bacterium]|nr:hypothetical protein [Candidatus Uhrbacteria bacterium]MBI4812379.1 hypothetical protein [Candidatus Falkowbacteria bacterium]